MENLDPPPPPPKSRMGRWRGFALRAASSLIWGGGEWGFSVPFYFVQDCILETSNFSVDLTDGPFFIYVAPVANNFFVCLRLPANTLFFTCMHAIYFSVYSLCKQFISKFSKFPRQKKIMFRP